MPTTTLDAKHPLSSSIAQCLSQNLRVTMRPSDWEILDSYSGTTSVGTPLARIALSESTFAIVVSNRVTNYTALLIGLGGGVDIGFGGLSPVDYSGDLPFAPKLPGWNSPIYVGPAGQGLSPAELFGGFAIISGVSIGGGEEASAVRLVFCDLLALTTLGMYDGGIKAAALLTGLDYFTNTLSLNFSTQIYRMVVTPIPGSRGVSGSW